MGLFADLYANFERSPSPVTDVDRLRQFLELREPRFPKKEQLENYLDGRTERYLGKVDPPMSGVDHAVWLQMRQNAKKAYLRLTRRESYKVPPSGMPRLGYLVRDPEDPWAIWVEVDGVRVDRLIRSAVRAWEGGPAERYPVLCQLFNWEIEPKKYAFIVFLHIYDP